MTIRTALAFYLTVPPLSIHAATAAEGTARIEIEQPAFDFGSVVFGERISHDFAVRNEGGSPLLVQEVSSPCDCVHAAFESTIGPRQTGRIHVDVDTSALQGPVYLTVRVRSNDPERSIARMEIKGFVKGPIMLLPRDHLDLTTLAGENQESTVTLEVNRQQPLKVLGVDSTSAVFAPRFETVSPQKRYRIVVKADGNQPTGLYQGTVRIRTDDGKQKIIALQCTLLVVSSVVADPTALYLPALDRNDARNGVARSDWKVTIKHVHNRAFEVVSVKPDLPVLQVRYEARADGASHEIFVQILPNDVLRPGRTVVKLHVKTSLPEAQDLQIPVWVEVR